MGIGVDIKNVSAKYGNVRKYTTNTVLFICKHALQYCITFCREGVLLEI